MTTKTSTVPAVAPITQRGADGRAHLVTDLKGEAKARATTRIRPIVPNVFRNPD